MLGSDKRAAIAAGLMLIGLLVCGCQTLGSQLAGPPGEPPAATTISSPLPAAWATVAHSPTSPAATHTPSPTLSPSAAPTVSPTSPPTPVPTTVTPEPSPTPRPATPTASATPTPSPPAPMPTASRTSAPPSPTATTRSFRFYPSGPAQPDPSHPCPSCPRAPAYIVGRVTDAAGNGLAGVRLVCYNEWHRYPVVASKGGGEYDFPIIQADTTWTVVIVDQNDQPISPESPVPFELAVSCRYILDWRRVD